MCVEGQTMTQQAEDGSKAKGSLHDRVATVLDTLRPYMQRDGGDIELVEVNAEGVVHVRLQGACIGCPSASMTLTMGIERNLKDQIPEVKRVVCVQ
jgi:Fe-S cluster biogenesis protein NfuA